MDKTPIVKKVQVRFSSGEIYAKMVALAKEDNRSLNGEIMQAFQEFIEKRTVKAEEKNVRNQDGTA